MNRIELNHWFIDNNSLSISLMNFCVKINHHIISNNTCFVMQVIHEQDNIFLYFNSLEEAIKFTENIVINCTNMDEVLNKYHELNGKILSLKR